MNERVFFESGNVKVTNARIVVNGHTYQLSNVSSCWANYTEHLEADDDKRARLRKYFLIVGGVIGLGIAVYLGGEVHEVAASLLNAATGEYVGRLVTNIVGWLMFVLLGVFASFLASLRLDPQKTYRNYHVHLQSAGSEQQIISSRDKQWIDNIIAAINDAMIYRSGV